MHIKEVQVGTIDDSRGEDTIFIKINGCVTAAPSGKSKGKYEVPDYRGSIKSDFTKLKALEQLGDFDFKEVDDLIEVERLLRDKVGANTLFALEASILKAVAAEKRKELWQLLGNRKMPILVSNVVEGGVHAHNSPKPDFQEFLVIGNKETNMKAYSEIGWLVKAKSKSDEHAWQTKLKNEEILEIMSLGKSKFGIDAAASEFYSLGKYLYKNPKSICSRQEQIDYIIDLIENYKISYVEDPLQQDDFKGFAEILSRIKGCLIVGDDLTVTNLQRVQKAIKMKAINALIVKPNQTGSLLEVKKVIDLCKKNKIKTVMSHRSGETMDYTIADLAVGFGCDYIKIPVSGKERLAKVARLDEIKKKL